MFVPPQEGHDFREAHVFDFSPNLWHKHTARARRDLLSPVAAPEDTVIDCKGSGLAFVLASCRFVSDHLSSFASFFMYFADA